MAYLTSLTVFSGDIRKSSENDHFIYFFRPPPPTLNLKKIPVNQLIKKFWPKYTKGLKLISQAGTVLPAKSDSGVMFCLQSYLGLTIDTSLVY